MAIYETVVILDSLLPPKDIDDFVERVESVIKEHGGTVRVSDKWGKRRLAYEIQKKQYGFYFAVEFEGDGEIPNVLQSEYNFNDNVLRYLTYRYDKHKLKAMASQKSAKPAEEKPVKTVVADEKPVEPIAEEQVKEEKNEEAEDV